MPPKPTCTTISAATTQKYFSVAFIDGVIFKFTSGFLSGIVCSSSPLWRSTAMYHASTATPAISSTTLTIDHSMTCDDGRLSISDSDGQLLLYVTSEFGRFVAHAHDAQKKNAC